MSENIIYTTYPILPSVALALASFFLAILISRMTIRKIYKLKRGIIILFSSIEYIILQILLYLIGVVIQADIVYPWLKEGSDSQLFSDPILIGIIIVFMGIIVFIINSISYLNKISVNVSEGVSIKESKNGRKLFFISLAVYIFTVVGLIPIIKLMGYPF